MNLTTLTGLGLNETQAKAYIALVKNGSITPPELSEKIKITRTNSYAVLDQLTQLNLCRKVERGNKYIYRVENPIALEKLARRRRKDALEKERLVQASMPTMLNFFYTFSDKPGVKFYQGTDGIQEMYNDTLRTCKDIYLIRSRHDQDLMSMDYYTKYKKKRAELGIKTYMLNPSIDKNAWNFRTDKAYNIQRTNIKPEDYSSNVELSIYGDKTALISFGEEAFGTIIESPQIAEAMRQLFALAEKGASMSKADDK